MKILLMSPGYTPDKEIYPPYRLACLSGYIRQKCPYAHVEAVDLKLKPEMAKEKDYNQYDVIVFIFMYMASEWMYEQTSSIKINNPDLIIIHSGVHATARPDMSLNSGADIVIRSEAELTLSLILDELHKDRESFFQNITHIDGINYSLNSKVYVNKDASFIQNLDELAWAYWDEYNFSEYKYSTLHDGKGFALPIMYSRGCLYNCDFCCSAIMWKRKVRYRSASNVVDEIQFNINKFGVNRFHFYDDDFLNNINFVIEFCDLIINKKITIEFVIITRSDSVNANRNIMALLKKAGCLGMEVGLESFDNIVLSNMNKEIALNDIVNTYHILKENNFWINFLLMFCYPGETINGLYNLNKFINLTMNTDSKFVTAQRLVPLPGTRIYDNTDNLGINLDLAVSERTSDNVVFIPNSMLNEIPVIKCDMPETYIDILITSCFTIIRKIPYETVRRFLLEILNIMDGFKSVRQIICELCKTKIFNEVFTMQLAYEMINHLAQMDMIEAKNRPNALYIDVDKLNSI